MGRPTIPPQDVGKYIPPQDRIYRFLDSNGDGTGEKNVVGDYAETPTKFFFAPDRACELHRMIVHLEGSPTMQAGEYGHMPRLPNGYSLVVEDDSGVLLDFHDGLVIKTNAQLGRTSYDVDIHVWGSGNEVLQNRFSFDKSGKPLQLRPGQRLAITFSDKFTALIEHYFQVQGFYT